MLENISYESLVTLVENKAREFLAFVRIVREQPEAVLGNNYELIQKYCDIKIKWYFTYTDECQKIYRCGEKSKVMTTMKELFEVLSDTLQDFTSIVARSVKVGNGTLELQDVYEQVAKVNEAASNLKDKIKEAVKKEANRRAKLFNDTNEQEHLTFLGDC